MRKTLDPKITWEELVSDLKTVQTKVTKNTSANASNRNGFGAKSARFPSTRRHMYRPVYSLP